MARASLVVIAFDASQNFWEPFTRDGRRAGVETISNSAALLDSRARASVRARPLAIAPFTPRITSPMTASFDTFYAAQRGRLVRGLSLAIGDEALANDAVDEAFTRALHRWHVVGAFDEPQAWVYRTARNWANSRFRRRTRDRRFAPKIATPESSVDPTPDPQLAEALGRLPGDQRNVLVLRYYLDWSIEATADALDVSPGTVKSRTNRALGELHRLLGDRA